MKTDAGIEQSSSMHARLTSQGVTSIGAAVLKQLPLQPMGAVAAVGGSLGEGDEHKGTVLAKGLLKSALAVPLSQT